MNEPRYRVVNLGQVEWGEDPGWDPSGGTETGMIDEDFTVDPGPAAPAEPGFFDQVGGFFSDLFTASNIKAGISLLKDPPKVAPLQPRQTAAPAQAAIPTNTLLLIGGGTIAAVIAVALLTRKSE